MRRTLVLALICLVGGALADMRFPTNFLEIQNLEKALSPKGAKTPKLTKADLDNPDKLEQLANELEKMAGAPSPQTKKREKKRRQLFLKSVLKSVNDKAEMVGDLVKPVGKFLGVDFENRRDSVNTGMGLATMGIGHFLKKGKQARYQRMYAIMEHKYHLNNLYLDSIGHQNTNADYADKVLSRVLNKVVKTRKAVLAKIHASINPMN